MRSAADRGPELTERTVTPAEDGAARVDEARVAVAGGDLYGSVELAGLHGDPQGAFGPAGAALDHELAADRLALPLDDVIERQAQDDARTGRDDEPRASFEREARRGLDRSDERRARRVHEGDDGAREHVAHFDAAAELSRIEADLDGEAPGIAASGVHDERRRLGFAVGRRPGVDDGDRRRGVAGVQHRRRLAVHRGRRLHGVLDRLLADVLDPKLDRAARPVDARAGAGRIEPQHLDREVGRVQGRAVALGLPRAPQRDQRDRQRNTAPHGVTSTFTSVETGSHSPVTISSRVRSPALGSTSGSV